MLSRCISFCSSHRHGAGSSSYYACKSYADRHHRKKRQTVAPEPTCATTPGPQSPPISIKIEVGESAATPSTTRASLTVTADSPPSLEQAMSQDLPEVYFHAYSFLELKSLSVVPQSQAQELGKRGCLFVPTRPLLDEFLRKYFLYVHPALPMLNEAEVWSMYHAKPLEPSGDRNLSLFVLQSILFASSGVRVTTSVEHPPAKQYR